MTASESETIRLARSPQGWLADYENALVASGLGEISRQVILEDARYIADQAAFDAADSRWHASRVRTGAVMGAVQSGKTASMIGVVARSLDNGVNVVVVLAGTQVSLWQQSLNRIQAQLDGGARPMLRRLFLPNPDTIGAERRAGPAAAYGVAEGQARRALERGRPIIFVAMKQVDHLLHLGQVLHKTIYPAAEAAGVPVRLLVVDDEADDSSVADDGVPWGVGDLDEYKQIPRRIVDLWEARNEPGRTVSGNVFATYVAYTATPQANFLQDPQNPLSPRDFVASLRTPGPRGGVEPRELTYRVEEGLTGWYTGADVFYGALANVLCVAERPGRREPLDVQADRPTVANGTPNGIDVDEIVDATRAFLVASAIRLSRSPDRLGPASARPRTFPSRDDAVRGVAAVSSMLIHPSSAMESHFEVAARLQSWWDGPSGEPGAGVLSDLLDDETAWLPWLESFQASRDAVASGVDDFGAVSGRRHVPAWDEVKHLIETEIVPGTSVAVVNSDPNADERPSYEPSYDGACWHAPRNHSTIFVSGNVMSRGLTLEGLLTTLFTRRSSAPLADTQMQMQRWFGYRGAYIDLCRVFLSRAQLELFTRYADADHALRSQVLAAMQSSGVLPDFTVLQGHAFQATGKISGLTGKQLRPGSRPFVRHLNPPGETDDNVALVAEFFLGRSATGNVSGDRRGLVSLDTLSLLECADLLDQLRYHDHAAVAAEADRWRAAERQVSLSRGDPEFPLYRAPASSGLSEELGSRSPYAIAAYLRLWSACLDRNVRGLLTDDTPPQRWSLLNLDMKRANQPRFRIGVRFGAAPPVKAGPFAALGEAMRLEVRPMARRSHATGELAAEWGSRKPTDSGYVGDDLFDATVLGLNFAVHPDGSRMEGAPGLVLFHLVHREAGDGIAVGLSIPSGGPDHTEAVSPARRRGTPYAE
ncbi:hypothetical protein GCM10009774_07270 [Cellulomonas gelida]|uniref:Putative endonuclease Z1 domain-containing protein n=2 Tax=Cellulomonas gelida TaxID=1712 RepID=A0A4Y3KIC6_9CELL|nr:hypothetical protein CGE01nite_14200 [Cellulomonas gelida]GGL19546.1 hypothetical protein GCM10009774_07270 [Cellulomonas gelida]